MIYSRKLINNRWSEWINATNEEIDIYNNLKNNSNSDQPYQLFQISYNGFLNELTENDEYNIIMFNRIFVSNS